MKQQLTKTTSFIKEFIKKYRKDQVNLYSAQATYFIIASSVPFLMLMLSLTRVIYPMSQEMIFEVIHEAIPNSLRYYEAIALKDLYMSGSTRSLISFSAITTLFSASGSSYALAMALHKVYNVPSFRKTLKIRLLSMLYALLLITLMVFSLIMLVFANRISDLVYTYLPHNFAVIADLLDFGEFFSILAITLVFAFLYKILSGSVLPYKKHLKGAFLSSLLWILFSFLYSVYIDHFSSFSVTYGSLTTIVLMMFWIRFCMMIFLAGAEFNVLINKKTDS